MGNESSDSARVDALQKFGRAMSFFEWQSSRAGASGRSEVFCSLRSPSPAASEMRSRGFAVLTLNLSLTIGSRNRLHICSKWLILLARSLPWSPTFVGF